MSMWVAFYKVDDGRLCAWTALSETEWQDVTLALDTLAAPR